MSRNIVIEIDGGRLIRPDEMISEWGIHDTIMALKELKGWEIQVALFHCRVARMALDGQDMRRDIEDKLSDILEQTEHFILGQMPPDEFVKVRERLKTLSARLSYTGNGRLKMRAVRSAVLNLERSYDYRIDLIDSCFNSVFRSSHNKKAMNPHFKNPYYDPSKRPECQIADELGRMCRLEGIYGKTNRRLAKEPDFTTRTKALSPSALAKAKLAEKKEKLKEKYAKKRLTSKTTCDILCL